MINIRENGNVYEVTFKYDPQVVALIRNVPGKQWLADCKIWTIPKDKLGFLLNELKGTKFESLVNVQSYEHINENADIEITTKIPDVDISDVNYRVKKGSKPYKHQLDFMKYAIDRQHHNKWGGFLVCDQQGLAKTNEAMNLAIYNREHHKFRHCLIICCINTSKYNWRNDIIEHTQGQAHPYILGTRLRRDGAEKCNTGSKEKIEDLRTGHKYGDENAPKLPYFLIVNIEAFRAKEGKKFAFADEVIRWINSGQIQMVVIDEIHKNASATSIQGKQLLRIKKSTGRNTMWLPMTGTPITSKPTDLFLPLKLIDAHNYTSYYSWCNQFCIFGGYSGHDILGYKNIPMLKGMLQANMIRRLKKDVLDLPDKIHYTEYVENTPYQNKLYRQITGELKKDKSTILQSLNPLTQFLRLRQVNGAPELVDNSLEVDRSYIKKNAKLQCVLQLLEDISARGEKTLIFSNWVEPLRTLYRFIAKRYKTCCYTGTMSEADREHHKHVFQTNPEYTVMIGTIGAMGTTHTLTAASNVIFYDEPWTPSDKEQAEDRAHRIGTAADSINIYTVLSKDTIDDRVHDIVYTKDSIGKFIVDNDLSNLRKNPQLFDFLLGKNNG